MGALMIEVITGTPPLSLPSGAELEQCYAMARGGAPYPWERSDAPAAFQNSRIKDLVLACLQRKPQDRTTAAGIMRVIGSLTM